MALETGPVNSERELKSRLSEPETVLFSLSELVLGCLKKLFDSHYI
jgi:hypothetical protein